THTITLTAKDPQGLSASVVRTLIVTAPPVTNVPPNAWIATPAQSASFTQGASVGFSGGATDPEDGTLSGAAMVWKSDRDGQIGTGVSFSKTTLSAGSHLISLTATDSKGA